MSTVRVSVVRRAKVSESDAWIRKIVAATLLAAGERKAMEVGVTLIGDEEMRRLNRVWRGKDRTTDVLSFEEGSPWPAGKGTLPFLGDIIISIPQVRRQAKEGKKLFKKEFALMLAHGALHLLGYDHMNKKDEAEMFPIQDKILKKLGLI